MAKRSPVVGPTSLTLAQQRSSVCLTLPAFRKLSDRNRRDHLRSNHGISRCKEIQLAAVSIKEMHNSLQRMPLIEPMAKIVRVVIINIHILIIIISYPKIDHLILYTLVIFRQCWGRINFFYVNCTSSVKCCLPPVLSAYNYSNPCVQNIAYGLYIVL